MPADPLYPDVPDEAGVPPVRRLVPADNGVQQVQSQGKNVSDLASGQWGIFTDGGAAVLKPDSIAAFEYSRDYRISDYPQEKGGFASYNKVAMPFDVRVTMTKGGPLAEREQFLQTLDTIHASLDLYNVVTPEKTYLAVNVERTGLVRSSDKGATMLTVEVGLREIRESATSQFSNSKSPAAADDQDGGSVQPTQEEIDATPPSGGTQ